MTEFCSSFLSSIQVEQADLFGFTFGVLNMVITLVLLAWLRRSRRKALAGSALAAHTLVLPIYLWMMYGVATADAFHGAVYLTCGFWDSSGATPVVCSVLRGCAWGAHHFVLEGIAFFLLHQGAGTRVVSRSARLALLWAVATTAIQTAAFLVTSNDLYLGLVLGYEVLLFAFYVVCWLLPGRYLFRRPALAGYAAYWCLVRAVNAASYIMIDQATEGGSCILAANTVILFTLVQPFVVYRAFVRDSQYWQGIVPASAVRSDIVQPLLGNQWGPASVAAMNDGLDEMHANRVHIINFGFLSLGAWRGEWQAAAAHASLPHLAALAPPATLAPLTAPVLLAGANQQVLGAGGTARVFRGAYRGNSVAVKMMFCVELDADLIAAFCEEVRTAWGDALRPRPRVRPLHSPPRPSSLPGFDTRTWCGCTVSVWSPPRCAWSWRCVRTRVRSWRALGDPPPPPSSCARAAPCTASSAPTTRP